MSGLNVNSAPNPEITSLEASPPGLLLEQEDTPELDAELLTSDDIIPVELGVTVDGGGSSAVTSVNGFIGDVVLTGAHIKTRLQTGNYLVEDVEALQANKENLSNKVISISEASTDTEYPSAKAVYTYASSTQHNHDDRYYQKSEVDSKLLNEQTARINADNTLTVNLSLESTTREQADTVLQNNISAEESARIAADTSEQAARISADNAEQAARTQADALEIQNRTNADNAEVAARIAADNLEISERTAAIAVEKSQRETADMVERDARMIADQVLQYNLDEESDTRSAADITLTSALLEEVTQRATADTAEQTARISADTTLQTNLDIESATRSLADTTESTRAQEAEQALNTTLTTEISARSIADTILTDALTEEIARSTNIDTGLRTDLTTETSERIAKDTALETTLTTHTTNLSNPHAVTKAQVGLGEVPNVTTNNQTPTYTEAETLEPLSSGEVLSTAFGKLKKALTDLISHLSNTSNPHSVTKAQVGLGNCNNTSDADKPISTLTQQALDNKSDITHIHNYAGSATAGGSATSAVRLDTTTAGSAIQPCFIQDGQPQACTHTLEKSVPSDALFTDHIYVDFIGSGTTAAAGLVPKPSTAPGTAKYLREDATWVTPPDTTYSEFIASGPTAASGLVPSPGITAGQIKYLREDSTWAIPPNTTYSLATESTDGLLRQLDNNTTTFMRGDGTWAIPPDTTYELASTSSNGLLKQLDNNTSHFMRGDGAWESIADLIVDNTSCDRSDYILTFPETSHNYYLLLLQDSVAGSQTVMFPVGDACQFTMSMPSEGWISGTGTMTTTFRQIDASTNSSITVGKSGVMTHSDMTCTFATNRWKVRKVYGIL